MTGVQRLLYGVGGYLIIAVLLDRYDEAHSTTYFWWYTVIIWLGFVTANSAEFVGGLNAAVAALKGK